jgi:hypothetical protein
MQFNWYQVERSVGLKTFSESCARHMDLFIALMYMRILTLINMILISNLINTIIFM